MIFQITITFWNTSISISYLRVNFSCPETTMTDYYKDVVVNNHKLDDFFIFRKLDDLYLSNYHYITFWYTSVSYARVNFSSPETTKTDYYKYVIVVVNIICTCDTFIFTFMSCVTLSFLCVTLSCAVTVTVTITIFHVNVFRIRKVRRQISLCSFK